MFASKADLRVIKEGTVTTPEGFLAGATYAGLKSKGDDPLDLAILYSEASCTIAGVFTSNRIKAAPVLLSQERLARGKAHAVVVNSGCANACTGERGLRDAEEMASLAARRLGIPPEEVLVASTGVIGVGLPMDKIRPGIERLPLSREGGEALARAIMTTDTFPKRIAVEIEGLEEGGAQKKIRVGGVAKGAGMIHPTLATLLCFLTTDAAVEGGVLEGILKKAVANSFNMVTIDGDTSPNDTVLILANGLSGVRIGEGNWGGELEKAVEEVCIYLAKCIARDGEGATRLIEVTVEGALSLQDARAAARAVVGSSLVKAAVHGCDPNWGRIIAAVGRSGAEVEGSRIDLFLDNLCLMRAGSPLPFDKGEAMAILSRSEVPLRVCLNLGGERATAWGCDLSEEYVTINSAYMT